MENFDQLEFHNLKLNFVNNKKALKTEERIKDANCMKCQDECPGFVAHSWRNACDFCKCFTWEHAMHLDVNSPLEIMQVVEEPQEQPTETDIASQEGFIWVPKGLDSSQVATYMSQLNPEDVPKFNTSGAVCRTRKLYYQFPPHDFDKDETKNLNENASVSFEQLCRSRVMEASGIGAVQRSIVVATKCSGCNEVVSVGQMAIFTEKLGCEACWHPQCFRCCTDGDLLIDLLYFVFNQKLYCARHWSEQIKPRCHACEELIYIGEYTRAMEKSWHMNHFCCTSCDGILTRKKYVIVDDKPYCQNCYNTLIAKVCSNCGNRIGTESKDLVVKEKHYHKECLNCSQCKKSLESQIFTYIDEKPMCHKCRGIDMERSKFCTQCNLTFSSDEKKIYLNRDYFHTNCFLCSQCNQTITTLKYIKKADGSKICDKCFRKTAKTCSKCQKVIRSASVTFIDNTYHVTCFTCTNCSRELGGTQFYKNGDEPFCEDCFLSNHAKLCAACYDPIEGNTKFIDYDSKYWHSKCFVCCACKKALAGIKFIIRDGERLCMECK